MFDFQQKVTGYRVVHDVWVTFGVSIPLEIY